MSPPKRFESLFFCGGVAILLLYAYFMASVHCANYRSCDFASAEFAEAVFSAFGMK